MTHKLLKKTNKNLTSLVRFELTDTVVQFSQSFVSMYACAAVLDGVPEVTSCLMKLRNAIEVREGTLSNNIFIHIRVIFLWIHWLLITHVPSFGFLFFIFYGHLSSLPSVNFGLLLILTPQKSDAMLYTPSAIQVSVYSTT